MEPIMKVEVVCPEEFQGDIMGDLNRRRGKITNIDAKQGANIVKCDVPLAEMFGYSTVIRTLSSGRASYSMEPSHFEQVPNNIVEQIVEQRGGNK
jgi:elongation factor G